MENTKNSITINGNVTVNVTNNAITPTDTNEINITENTTLGELLKLLNLGEKPHEIPTPKKLRENAGKPIAFYPMSGSMPVENVECTVYSNGFAVYDNGSGRTVLWLPDCTSFTYVFTKPKASEGGMLPYKEEIPDEMLESLSWFMAVTLIGDHRVENNLMNRKSGRSMSVNYDAYDYDDKQYADYDVWIRNTLAVPNFADGRKWTFWQYSDKGELDGYKGEEKYIDMNVFNGTHEEFQNYAKERTDEK